jgi:signal transduction histidine kinase
LQQAKLTEPYGYLVKPIQPQELYATIEMALYKHKMEKALRDSEEKLKVYAEHLEEMVEERTQKLQEAWERLLRQEKLAVLGQLVGGVAHELRNPLATMKVAAYFLKMGCDEFKAEEKKALEILEREFNMAEQIITNLLDFAQPKTPTLTPVNANEVILAALARITVPAEVEVITCLAETLQPIMADPYQLTLVLVNIINNAIQAMFKGGRLTLTSTMIENGVEANNNSWVAISIADTGVGITPENLEKIFEPLFTTKTKGIGLGLALSRTLIEKQGGSIEVASQLGQGSVFTIRLCPCPP